MSRGRSHGARFPWSPRRQAWLLLLAWCVSLLLPAFHLDASEPGDGGLFDRCSGLFAPEGDQPSIDASCDDGAGCENPWHHHHADSRHDPTQCPSCSSLLERIEAAALPIDFAPTLVELAAPRTVRLPPIAERLVVALARGPPSAPSGLPDGARGA